jgi:hypothetical protein
MLEEQVKNVSGDGGIRKSSLVKVYEYGFGGCRASASDHDCLSTLYRVSGAAKFTLDIPGVVPVLP